MYGLLASRMREVVAASPLEEVPPCALFAGISPEAWRWLHVEGRASCSFLERYLPGLTGDSEMESRWVGSSGSDTLAEGFDVYELFKGLYERYAGPLTPD